MTSQTVSRRRFLALSAATAGVEGIVAAHRAPAFAQGTRLHLVQWSHFIPAADQLFDKQAARSHPSGPCKQADMAVDPTRVSTRRPWNS